MIKHVGRHNNRKVIVLFRTVPGEDHMALVTYTDSLPASMHDDIMRTLESQTGQQAKEFSDALNRAVLADGRPALQAMHREGYIKKVPTNQVIMTPTTTSTVRLDELNTILTNMEAGEDAVKKMAEIDAQTGMRNSNSPPLKKDRDVGEPAIAAQPLQASADGVLDDAAIAKSFVDQATQMRKSAEGMLAEAARLEKEAAALAPQVAKKPATTAKKATASTAKAAPKTTTKKVTSTAKPTNGKTTKTKKTTPQEN